MLRSIAMLVRVSRFVPILLVGFVTTATTAQERGDKVFRAGAAVADITPPLGEMIVGGFEPFPADEVHDPLHARCLVMDDGTTRVAIVICDSLGIRREEYEQACELITEETEISVENILMAATHTHSATRAQTDKYRPILIRGIADAVHAAVSNLRPATIGWGGVEEPTEVFNRRWYVDDPELRHNPFGGIDKVRMNPPRGNRALIEPAGPIDPEISVLSLRGIDGSPIAVLANYSLHYVGGVGRGDVSADYFGLFSNRIAELLGNDSGGSDPGGSDSDGKAMVGMLSNGTSGDINNINFRINDGRRWEEYEKMRYVADLVAERVQQVCEQATYLDWVSLRSVRRELPLTMRKPDVALESYIAGVEAKQEGEPVHHRYERIYAERVRDLQAGPDEIEVPLQCLGIGDLAILAIPFEVFVEIGLELKAKSPFADTFVIELANDSRGYLPTPRQHELGGYETWMGTNRVQLDASDRISETLLEMLEEIK